jgi:hypothetical protein
MRFITPHAVHRQPLWRWFVLILVLGFGLRIWQIGYGLPRVLFTDEEFFTVPALRIADGGLNPGWYGAPASPQIYSIGILWKVQNAAVNITARQHLSPSERYEARPNPFILSARLLSVVIGTYMILLVFLLGSYITPRIGLIAAGLVAGNFFLIEHSHIIRPDIWQIFFLLEAILAGWKIAMQPGRKKNYFVFGTAIALAITQKLTSIILLPVAVGLLAILSGMKRIPIQRLWLVGGVVIAVAILSMPYLVLAPVEVAKDVVFEILQPHGTHTNLGLIGNLSFYLRSLGWQLGSLLGIGSILLFAWTWKTTKRFNSGVLLFGLALLYFLGLLFARHAWDRWMIPVVTMLAVPMAVGIDTAFSVRRLRLVTTILVLTALLGPTVRLIRTIASYSNVPTSENVRIWILNNTKVGSIIVADPYAPKDIPGRTITSVSSIGVRPTVEYGSGVYLIANHDIRNSLLQLGERNGPTSSYAIVGGRYAQLAAASDMVYTTEMSPNETVNDLVMANDLIILTRQRLAFLRGPMFTVYRVPSKQ